MGIVSAYSPGGTAVPAAQYGGEVRAASHVSSGGHELVPAYDWTNGADPDSGDIGDVFTEVSQAEPEVPVKRGPGRPKKVQVSLDV